MLHFKKTSLSSNVLDVCALLGEQASYFARTRVLQVQNWPVAVQALVTYKLVLPNASF